MRAERNETIWQGLMAGLFGYATVALLVGAIDVLLGRSFFYTAALLGEWLFYGLKDPAQLTVWPGAVFAYNGVHLLTFLGFGLLAAWLASMAERGPALWYAGMVLFLLAFLRLFAAVLFMAEPLAAVLPGFEIWLPGIAAAVVMVAYLLHVHPKLLKHTDDWQEQATGT